MEVTQRCKWSMLGKTRKCNKPTDDDEYCDYHKKHTVKTFPSKICG